MAHASSSINANVPVGLSTYLLILLVLVVGIAASWTDPPAWLLSPRPQRGMGAWTGSWSPFAAGCGCFLPPNEARSSGLLLFSLAFYASFEACMKRWRRTCITQKHWPSWSLEGPFLLQQLPQEWRTGFLGFLEEGARGEQRCLLTWAMTIGVSRGGVLMAAVPRLDCPPTHSYGRLNAQDRARWWIEVEIRKGATWLVINDEADILNACDSNTLQRMSRVGSWSDTFWNRTLDRGCEWDRSGCYNLPWFAL